MIVKYASTPMAQLMQLIEMTVVRNVMRYSGRYFVEVHELMEERIYSYNAMPMQSNSDL